MFNTGVTPKLKLNVVFAAGALDPIRLKGATLNETEFLRQPLVLEVPTPTTRLR